MFTYTDRYGEMKADKIREILGFHPVPMTPGQPIPITGRWVIHAYTRIVSCDSYSTGWMSGTGARKQAILFDNYGQKYIGDIPVPLHTSFQLQMWYPGGDLALKKPLADQVIDVIKTSYPGDSLEPLITLIESLTPITSSINKNSQTEYSSTNTGIQTNTQKRNGFANTLRKTCAGKSCNIATEGIQTNNFRNRNNRGFVKTLRKSCSGKNCNVNSRGIQTNAAYVGRRHSMVNTLRKTVESARPNVSSKS